MRNIVEITDRDGRLLQPAWLARAESVHRQLRPQLPADYAGRLAEVFAHGGRMVADTEGDAVTGVAVYRVLVNTFSGRALYVDDLVTDENRRSGGVGKRLLDWLEQRARGLQCAWLTLDSGTQRHHAHRFYFRERMVVSSFHFQKQLS